MEKYLFPNFFKNHKFVWWILFGWWLYLICLPFLLIILMFKIILDKKYTLNIEENKIELIKNNKTNEYRFRIMGLYYHQDNLLKYLREVKKEVDKDDLWEGYSNKEMIEAENYCHGLGKYYEFGGNCLSYYDNLKLVVEDVNKYSKKTAVAIYIRNYHLGYVPKELSMEIASKIKDNKEYIINWELSGGKYKTINYDEYTDEPRIDIEEDDRYEINIKLFFKN